MESDGCAWSVEVNNKVCKFSEATKVTVGSLSIEIQAKALEYGNNELADKLKNITPEAIDKLIHVPKIGDQILIGTGNDSKNRQFFTLCNDNELKTLYELESKGLIVFREPLAGFMSFFFSLPIKKDESIQADFPSFKIKGEISELDLVRLRNQGYSLTSLGRKAVDAILAAIVEELKKDQSEKK